MADPPPRRSAARGARLVREPRAGAGRDRSRTGYGRRRRRHQAIDRDPDRCGAASHTGASLGLARRRQTRGCTRAVGNSISQDASVSMSALRPAAFRRCCSHAARGACTRSTSGTTNCTSASRARSEPSLFRAHRHSPARSGAPARAAGVRDNRRELHLAQARAAGGAGTGRAPHAASGVDQAAIRGDRAAISRRGSYAIPRFTRRFATTSRPSLVHSIVRFVRYFPRRLPAAMATANFSSRRTAIERCEALRGGAHFPCPIRPLW